MEEHYLTVVFIARETRILALHVAVVYTTGYIYILLYSSVVELSVQIPLLFVSRFDSLVDLQLLQSLCEMKTTCSRVPESFYTFVRLFMAESLFLLSS